MMKKLISLLICVCALLSVCACSFGKKETHYRFYENDMSDFASFDKVGFENELKKLTVKDGDFSSDPETRAKKVMYEIYMLSQSVGISNFSVALVVRA